MLSRDFVYRPKRVLVNIRIYRSWYAMHRGKVRAGVRNAKRHSASCVVWGKALKTFKKYITVFFNLKDFGAGVVTHEFFHAVNQIYPGKLNSRTEERAAVCIEDLTREFWKWYYEETDHGNKNRV